LDTGAQGSIISERVYNKLIYAGVRTIELAVQGAVLLKALGGRTRRIKKQAYLEFRLGEDLFGYVFLICPELVSNGYLGSDFAVENRLIFDFDVKCIRYMREGDVSGVQFSQCKDIDAAGVEQVQSNLSDHSSQNLTSNTPL
jgi:hypothetical protein